MLLAGSAVLSVLLLWWFATGAIFYLDGLPRRTFPLSVAAGVLVLGVSLYGLAATSDDRTVAGAFLACACAIGVWAFNEILFLTGYVTGPNRRPARPGLAGWARFRSAAASVMHHELAILVSGLAVLALTTKGGNDVGLWTFLVLWAMRLSAKLNIFVGVPNPGVSFLPDHLRYLAGHFRTGSVGAFFALSTSAATLALAALVGITVVSGPSDHEIVATTLVATLLALAIVEHWFLALPIPSAELWRWSLKARAVEPAARRGDLDATATPSSAPEPRSVLNPAAVKA